MSWAWREHDGVRYLALDYRGLSTDGMLELLEHQVREVEAAAPGPRVLIITDPNYTPDHRFLAAVKRARRDTLIPAGAKVAYVGPSGLGAAAIRGLQLMASQVGGRVFDDEQQAVAHLARLV